MLGASGERVLSAMAFMNHSLGNSKRQSLRYLPSNTPRQSISSGVRYGLNSGGNSP